MSELDPFLAKRELEVGGTYYALSALDDAGIPTKHLPYSMRVLLEGALRNCCLLYTSPSPRDRQKSRMPSSA